MASKKKVKLWKRIIMSIGGILLLAVAVTFFKFAALGVDPFQAFVSGLDQLIPLNFGTVYLLVNVAFFILVIFVERKLIGFVTILNMFLIGYLAQWGVDGLHLLMPEPAMWIRVIFLVFGVLIFAFSLAMCISANLGVSTYDAISLIVVNKWNKGKLSYMRIVIDLASVLLGMGFFFLGGGKLKDVPAIINVGTILAVFFTGPLIAFFMAKVTTPILLGKNTEPIQNAQTK